MRIKFQNLYQKKINYIKQLLIKENVYLFRNRITVWFIYGTKRSIKVEEKYLGKELEYYEI